MYLPIPGPELRHHPSKNRLICKGHLSYTGDFITKYQGRTDPTMKIDMHIFSAWTQYGYKIHPYLKGNLRETCTCTFTLPVLQDLSIHLQGLHVLYHACTCPLHVPTVQLVSIRCLLAYSSSGTIIGWLQLVCTCKSLLPHYQAKFKFFNNICSTRICV